MTFRHPGSRRNSPRFAAWGCGALLAGCLLLVGRASGAARSFVVERVEWQPKQALPVARIWNPAKRPVLRLISCGGSFDPATGHHRDNVIVYANLV